ncbi:MAG: hypothetical protein F7B17_02210 [Desulfurococcales archaeon]|nr:hypothetical protein [Desulfurococcales archaeon]
MAPEGSIDFKEVAWKLYEKLTPNIGLAIAGPTGALAASTLVVATWLLAKLRRSMGAKAGEFNDEEELVRVYMELREAERSYREAREAGAPEEVVKALEHKVRWLREEYELIQVRIAAKEALEAIAGREAVERLEDAVRRLERGEEKAMGEVHDVLREVEDLWRRRELEAVMLKRLISRDKTF